MKQTIQILKEKVKLSYAEYSNYNVSSLIEVDGEKYFGVNIENASYSLSCCAERVAVYNAYLKSPNIKKANKLYVYANSNIFPFPCGACLQVLNEFFSPELEVILINKKEEVKIKKLKDLSPYVFKGEVKK